MLGDLLLPEREESRHVFVLRRLNRFFFAVREGEGGGGEGIVKRATYEIIHH